MQTEKYIRNAILYLNSKMPLQNQLKGTNKEKEQKVEELVNQVLAALQNSSPAYDFTSYQTIKIKQGDKIRKVKKYTDFSTEQILCQYMKQILDKRLKIEYPNRNVVIHKFFDSLKAVKTMTDFTIIKIDFRDYFNSVSGIYVYEKYVKKIMDSREESALIEEFVTQTQYAYTGLATSNLLAEVIAQDFDEMVQMELADQGVIFYKRYIDDTVIILNRYLSDDTCNDILNRCLKRVFYDEEYCAHHFCATAFNDEKKKIITKRNIEAEVTVDFLGYEFFLQRKKDKIQLKYGITEEKRKKYSKCMEQFLEEYGKDHNIELLRHRILTFSSRTVYRRKKYTKDIWRVKGFIHNYGELRYLLETESLHSDTCYFLKNMIRDAFKRNEIPIPEFIQSNMERRGYSLYYNMQSNKTILLVETIGYNKKGLEKICRQVGIDVENKSYQSLVREYLLKTKVGDQ